MGDHLHFHQGLGHVEAGDLYPGSGRIVAFVKGLSDRVVSFNGFYIKTVEVFLYHILESGPVGFQVRSMAE
jgi:hypothetical protein